MDPDFWQQRWRDNGAAFPRDGVLPLLEEHWPTLGLATGSRVFVPLCGKSLDMAWLAARGHRVLGVELSPLAVGQFFDENGLAPTKRESPLGTHFTAGPIEIICGDAFALDAQTLADCPAVFERHDLMLLRRPLDRKST